MLPSTVLGTDDRDEVEYDVIKVLVKYHLTKTKAP